MTIGLIVFLFALGGVAVAGVGIYNSLVRLRNASENAWSDVDVQLKRRYELVPNLVATVKGYAAHEQKTFEEVTLARSRAMGAGALRDRASAEGELSRACPTCSRSPRRIPSCAPTRASSRSSVISRSSRTSSRRPAATTMPWCAI